MVSLVTMKYGWWWGPCECSTKAELDCPEIWKSSKHFLIRLCQNSWALHIRTLWIAQKRDAVAIRRGKTRSLKAIQNREHSRTCLSTFSSAAKRINVREMWKMFSGHLEEFINFKIYISRMEISFSVFHILSQRIRCVHFDGPIWDCEAEHKT